MKPVLVVLFLVWGLSTYMPSMASEDLPSAVMPSTSGGGKNCPTIQIMDMAERYQAIRMVDSKDSTMVFIIDTKEGHLWTWRKDASLKGGKMSEREVLIYQGKVVPGKRMGERIEQHHLER